MSITSGYFSSLGMIYAPRVVHPSKSRIAGMMAAFFLILGEYIVTVYILIELQITEDKKNNISNSAEIPPNQNSAGKFHETLEAKSTCNKR